MKHSKWPVDLFSDRVIPLAMPRDTKMTITRQPYILCLLLNMQHIVCYYRHLSGVIPVVSIHVPSIEISTKTTFGFGLFREVTYTHWSVKESSGLDQSSNMRKLSGTTYESMQSADVTIRVSLRWLFPSLFTSRTFFSSFFSFFCLVVRFCVLDHILYEYYVRCTW